MLLYFLWQPSPGTRLRRTRSAQAIIVIRPEYMKRCGKGFVSVRIRPGNHMNASAFLESSNVDLKPTLGALFIHFDFNVNIYIAASNK